MITNTFKSRIAMILWNEYVFIRKRRPVKTTQRISSAASDVFKKQFDHLLTFPPKNLFFFFKLIVIPMCLLYFIHISQPTKQGMNWKAVFSYTKNNFSKLLPLYINYFHIPLANTLGLA